MPDILILHEVAAVCQDGMTRHAASLVLRDGQYVFLDADGVALEGERQVSELTQGTILINPGQLGRITAKYGPIL